MEGDGEQMNRLKEALEMVSGNINHVKYVPQSRKTSGGMGGVDQAQVILSQMNVKASSSEWTFNYKSLCQLFFLSEKFNVESKISTKPTSPKVRESKACKSLCLSIECRYSCVFPLQCTMQCCKGEPGVVNRHSASIQSALQSARQIRLFV